MLKLTPAALRAPTLSIASDKEGEDLFAVFDGYITTINYKDTNIAA